MTNKRVGVDIGGTKMHMLAEVDGKHIEKVVPTGIDCKKSYIKEQLHNFIKGLPFKVEGVGMALPGLVIGDDKLRSSDVVPDLDGVEANYFSDGKFPVKFINDVNAATLTEANNYQDSKVVVVVMVGTGIAAGVAVDGKLFEGSQGFAGEVGYAYVPNNDNLERFDILSSGASILQKANCTAEELIERLNNKDQEAIKIIEDAGDNFGVLLGLIIQFYNPKIIVVGGTTSTYPGYMEKALETVKKATFPAMLEHCEIVRPKDSKRIVAKWGLLTKF